jgi:serine/threonine protein kinase
MALSPGDKPGPYEITGLLGQGGMGEVYRARDSRLNRDAAIKLLTDTLATATARRRFQREARMASALNHPHILTVYDVGDFDDQQYLVTEYVDAGTLRAWVKDRRPWKVVADFLFWSRR